MAAQELPGECEEDEAELLSTLAGCPSRLVLQRDFPPAWHLPLVAIATTTAGVQVWRRARRRWTCVCRLPDGGAGPLPTRLVWAPSAGRAWELLAVAAGARVTLFRLQGDVATVVSVLQLDSEVLSLDWDAAGTRLATLSADGKARLWSASLMSTEFRVEATLTP